MYLRVLNYVTSYVLTKFIVATVVLGIVRNLNVSISLGVHPEFKPEAARRPKSILHEFPLFPLV